MYLHTLPNTLLISLMRSLLLCRHFSNSEVIGSGNFSLVSKGEWNTPSGPCMVAIKHASGNNATLRMLQEAVVMVQLWHPNVVNLLGLLEPQRSVSVYSTCSVLFSTPTCTRCLPLHYRQVLCAWYRGFRLN